MFLECVYDPRYERDKENMCLENLNESKEPMFCFILIFSNLFW